MLSKQIIEKAHEMGFLGCGIIPVDSFKEYTDELQKRAKLFPDSAPLYESMHGAVNFPENAKSIIISTQRFNHYKVPENLKGLYGKVYLFDPRISYSRENRTNLEFETWLKLKGVNIVSRYVPARLAAEKAGLGRFARNNFIYDEKHGSSLWINTWVVSEDLPATANPGGEKTAASGTEPASDTWLACNDGCRMCIEACPTKALSGDFTMDMGRCITHLICFGKTLPDEKTLSAMGTWIYGCDVCQDACPMNKDKYLAPNGSQPEGFPLLYDFDGYLLPEQILQMDENTYKNILNPRFWYIGEEGFWLWKINAIRSLANSGDKKHIPLIKTYTSHEDERINKIALWALEKLG